MATILVIASRPTTPILHRLREAISPALVLNKHETDYRWLTQVRPHSALGYRPPAPATIRPVPGRFRPVRNLGLLAVFGGLALLVRATPDRAGLLAVTSPVLS